MNVDDIARRAAEDVATKAAAVPPPHLLQAQQRRRRRTRLIAAASAVTAIAAMVGVTLLVRSPDIGAPFVADPVPMPTTMVAVPEGEDLEAIESELERLEAEQDAIEEKIGLDATSTTVRSVESGDRDPLEVPYVYDLPDQRGAWTRIDDPQAVFTVEPFSESRPTEDGGTRTSNSGVRLSAVTEGPNGLIAAGSVSRGLSTIGAIWRSSDGNSWERVPHDPDVFGSLAEGHDVSIDAIEADDNGYVAVGLNGTTAVAWTSIDGITWTSHLMEAPDAGRMMLASLEKGNLGWIATGAESSNGQPPTTEPPNPTTIVHSQGAIWWSTDGRAWKRVESDALVSATSNLHVLDVVQTDRGLYAAGVEAWDPITRSDGAIWFSDDGLTWERLETPGLVGADESGIESITELNGLLVAVGQSRRSAHIWSSSDGTSWVSVHDEAPTTAETWLPIRDLVATESGLVAVGVSVTFEGPGVTSRIAAWHSIDGHSWSQVEPPSDRADGTVWDVTQFDGVLLAVGDLNAIPNSFDSDSGISLGADVGAVWTTPVP